MLDVGDGNWMYWEVSGTPGGKPALVVHGGPGSGSSVGLRRYFNPARYRVIQFDQRGCGRSTPHAGDPATDMTVNTTEHLLGDMERLREHLGIDRWLLNGGSWGSTLILAYAQRHPDRVTEIVIQSVTTSRHSEIDWCAWEDTVLSLLDRAHRLADIPGVLIHGRHDLGGPLHTAWALQRAWPGAELHVVEDAGHRGSTATRRHVLQALDRFAAQRDGSTAPSG